MLAAAAVLLGLQMLAAAPQLSAQNAPQRRATAAAHKVHHQRMAITPPPPATPEPAAAPQAAPPPDWPANDAPAQPAVTWDSQGLRINATNASLRQILAQVSTETGAKVEGLGNDERVFGEYGPGQARDVLSQLLHGSSYNVLMIGDQGQGTPREIVLSARRAASGSSPAYAGNPAYRPPPPSQDSSDDEAVEQPEPEEQPIPPPANAGQQEPPAANPGQPQPGAPRTPQQVMQELLQRQQQMLNQQVNPH